MSLVFRRFFSASPVAVWFAIGMLLGLFAINQVGANGAENSTADELRSAGIDALRRFEFPKAAEHFREFLQQFPQAKRAAEVRAFLAQALLDSQPPDVSAALAALKPLLDDPAFKDNPERGPIAHQAGRAMLAAAEQALARIPGATPEGVEKLRAEADDDFGKAAKFFGDAANAFATKVGSLSALEGKPFPSDLENAVLAKCEQVEILLRNKKYAEALKASAALVERSGLQRSVSMPRAYYLHGRAAFGLNDWPTAFSDLGRLAPFKQPGFGPHAQFLIAAMHQQAGEHPEAIWRFERVLTDLDAARKEARERLADAAQLRENPAERRRLELLLQSPPPDYAPRCEYHLGQLAISQNRFIDAATRFNNYLQTNPAEPERIDAQLQLGIALAQAKQLPAAIQVLVPLQKIAATAEQAFRWSARCRIAIVNPKPPRPGVRAADHPELKLAAGELANALEAMKSAAAEPLVIGRRASITFDLADIQVLLGRFPEATALYQNLLQDKKAGDFAEEASRRMAFVYLVAGKFNECETQCGEFEKKYPHSVGLADVLICSAENAVQMARDASGKKEPGGADAKKWHDEAQARFQRVLERFPEHPQSAQAHVGIAQIHYQLGRYAEAAEAFAKLPEAERVGDFANVNYLQADCLLRGVSADTSNALAAGRAAQQISEAIELLTKYVASPANGPDMPQPSLRLLQSQDELLTR